MTTPRPDISVVIGAYNMARELPRTLETLTRPYQRGLADLTCEVIVLDNGSNPAVDAKAMAQIAPGLQVIRPATVSISPAAALNAALELATAPLVGLFIDGARMASPGLLHLAHAAWLQDPSRAIGTLAFHLGPDMQMVTVPQGYDAATEDRLLESVPWRSEGYRLFDISVLAGSSRAGWHGTIAESNGLFMDSRIWRALGGLDTRFCTPGGGYCNLDLWERAVAASQREPWILLGEGTFHQVHGGAATNGTPEDRRIMAEEYERLHGHPFVAPQYKPRHLGSLAHLPPRHRES